MNASQTVTKIALALLKAQRKMGSASKDAKNPFFKSKYADYGSVLEVVKEPLNEEGIVILQPHCTHEGKTYVETVLMHESGEWVSSATEVVCAKQNDAQAMGSAITYARRYNLQSLLSIPTADDDGESTMNREKPQQTQPVKQEQPKTAPPAPVPPQEEPKRSSFKTQQKPEAAKNTDW